MKKLILFVLIPMFFAGCTDDPPNPYSNTNKVKVMKVYCQATPDELMVKVIYSYQGGNLITETTYNEGILESTKSYTYNSDNLLNEEIYKDDYLQIAKRFVYNELKQLVNIIYTTTHYDDNGQPGQQTITETPLEYSGNLLVKEWETCGAFKTYEYENGKVTRMTEYTELGQKHHITTYRYSGDLKTEEREETVLGSLIYLRTFQYTSDNQLLTITEDDHIIEQNYYDQNKLMEKRTYYFGIDPGFYYCHGNFIYRYEY